jgi:hypothetical protein
MGWLTKGVAAAVAVAAGGVAVGRAMSTRGRGNWPLVRWTDDTASRWQLVTIDRPHDGLLADDRLPEPLDELGEGVEVHVRAAPGGRGTELAARIRDGAAPALRGMAAHVTGDDPRLALRTALRQTKQLAETGELLSPDGPPTRRHTVVVEPLDLAIQQAREEGWL